MIFIKKDSLRATFQRISGFISESEVLYQFVLKSIRLFKSLPISDKIWSLAGKEVLLDSGSESVYNLVKRFYNK
jgi:hypothetical protein